ncbi:prenylated Rab acceptor protein 1 isoform X4 [Catharus ustulatus]|uniref:prenylated Rab acceptor protein 1 isoform X1 n=1 Tax=Catharus ustulatus TaxID=91951 RepID=UPI00140C82AA|nr:prenylated Rab acceptor protein 1 isoform X1 [Catharus ustulatus]XP_032940368.1 prenylated Rab acceptor protein 1 isoform X2 [Catharus ustulatus]XP_032940369.1 prenylated Rab acceptor protein 1 isoform X3 [Catharus ustulatus]XP_032940370.1 prenylated Rab acceptor protein 1 isoform X4 [Catharus ustulatus]
MAEAAPPPQELRDSDPRGGLGRVTQWLEARRAALRPWGSFLDQRRFGAPRDLGELWRRLGHNGERFQSNYVVLFLGLVAYCLITSPLLLLALGVFVGAAVAVRVRAREAPLVLLGRELSPAHQLGVAAGVSLPLFWLAGAGSAVFWVLGAALVFLGSHAAFRQLDPPELEMEPV